MSDLSLFVLTRNAGPQVCRAIDSVKDHVRELVVVDTGSDDNSREVIRKHWLELGKGPTVKFFEYSPKSHPKGFLLDAPETFKDGPVDVEKLQTSWSNLTFLANFGGARRSGWDRCTSKWVAYLDSDDVWHDADLIPEILAAAEKEKIDAVALPYTHRRDANGNVVNQHHAVRIVTAKGSTWRGKMHETLTVRSDQIGLFKDFGHVEDHHDVTDPVSRVSNRGWKALYWQYLRGDRHENDLYHLAMESRGLVDDFALKMFMEVVRITPKLELAAKCHVESGGIWERKSDFWAAETCFTSANLKFPGHPDALFGLARLAFLNNDYDKALRYTELGETGSETKLQHNPMGRVAWPKFLKASALVGLGRYEDAKKVARDLADKFPKEEHFVVLAKSIEQHV